jgi:hypothetical protein
MIRGAKLNEPCMLYRIIAWGSETLPDLDYETADTKDKRYKEYPWWSVRLLVPITREAIDRGLREKGFLK